MDEATELLKRHGYDCAISADELRRYSETDTFYPSATTWDEILQDWLTVAHEVVEVAELQRMALEITKDVVVGDVEEVYAAHPKAAEVEVELASAVEDYDHIRDRLEGFGGWAEDPMLPPDLEDEYDQLHVKIKRIVATRKETC